MKYNYPEHYADSVWSAIKLAEQLKESGAFDLFRGQRHTFDIQPSVLRSGVDITVAQRQLEEFASWVHRTPDLSSLHGNENAIIAVAQHYGLKTPFLDFTRSPQIAGFFATDEGKDGDQGTIICLNKKRFNESWKDLNRRYYEQNGRLLTEIVELDVNNLWRLHAQEGEFLKCHVDPSLLEMFSFFLHIYFPQKSGTSIVKKEKIYPTEKSHLEVLLDQYMLIDSYSDRIQKIEKFFTSIQSVSEEQIKSEMEKYFVTKTLPAEHESWHSNFAKQWMTEPKENYLKHGAAENVQLVIQTTCDQATLEVTLEEQLVKVIRCREPITRPSLKWSVVNEDYQKIFVTGEGVTNDPANEFIDFSVEDMVSSIYSGMRYLPFTETQIIRAISRYIMMLLFGSYQVIDDCEGVEFSGGEVRGRGFASRSRILGALREDFFELIDPAKLDADGKLSFSDSLYCARYVKYSYTFEQFLDFFVEDLIPSQAVIAVERLVIGVNPLRIDVFGES